jgi:hypothetical protein
MKAAPTGLKTARIVIVVEGGNVQEVLSNLPDIEVRLIDYDNEPEAEEPGNMEYPYSLPIN